VRLSGGVDIASSAANRLTGVVAAVIPGGIDSEVKIQLPSGHMLTAILSGAGFERTRSGRRQRLLRAHQGLGCPDRGQRLTQARIAIRSAVLAGRAFCEDWCGAVRMRPEFVRPIPRGARFAPDKPRGSRPRALPIGNFAVD
jgi:hypothetical protein